MLATRVARRYYIDGRTKIEIGNELQLSRFKVARLLEAARSQGLVRIEISHPGTIDVELSARLQETFGLQHAIVVNTHDEHQAALRQQLGVAAADLLTEIVAIDDVLGLAWARSVSAMVTELGRLPPIEVVQLTGALSPVTGSSSAIDDDSSIDVVREVARISGGPAYLFFAPFLLADPSIAEAMRRQPDVSRAVARMSSVTKAVVGIGRWAPRQSTLYDAASGLERQRLSDEGVCAEVGGVCLSARGEPLNTSLNDRMLAMTAVQLGAVPNVIAIPYGVRKRPAVYAALRSGLIHSVVTHTSLAAALLGDEPDQN